MGLEPLDYRVSELRQSADYGGVSGVAEISDVFDAWGHFGVRRERKDEGLNGGWVCAEKGV